MATPAPTPVTPNKPDLSPAQPNTKRLSEEEIRRLEDTCTQEIDKEVKERLTDLEAEIKKAVGSNSQVTLSTIHDLEPLLKIAPGAGLRPEFEDKKRSLNEGASGTLPGLFDLIKVYSIPQLKEHGIAHNPTNDAVADQIVKSLEHARQLDIRGCVLEKIYFGR